MIWRLCHRLLGWHYVLVHVGNGSYVRLVRETPNGRPYVLWCGEIWLLDEDGKKFANFAFSPLTWAGEPSLRRAV